MGGGRSISCWRGMLDGVGCGVSMKCCIDGSDLFSHSWFCRWCVSCWVLSRASNAGSTMSKDWQVSASA
jgi:hypothetical protein